MKRQALNPALCPPSVHKPCRGGTVRPGAAPGFLQTGDAACGHLLPATNCHQKEVQVVFITLLLLCHGVKLCFSCFQNVIHKVFTRTYLLLLVGDDVEENCFTDIRADIN